MGTLTAIAKTLELNSSVGIQLFISIIFLFLAKHFFLKDLLRVILYRSKNTVGASTEADKLQVETSKLQLRYEKLLSETIGQINKSYNEERKKISDILEEEYKKSESELQNKHSLEMKKMEEAIGQLKNGLKNSTKELSSQLVAKFNL